MTTSPYKLVATIHPKRMPVVLTNDSDFECWLNGTKEQALKLFKPYPASKMEIVQTSEERKNLG